MPDPRVNIGAIQLYRSFSHNRVPAAGSLLPAQEAVNLEDVRRWIGGPNGEVLETSPAIANRIYVTDANYLVTKWDGFVLYRTLTAARTVTLPAYFRPGQPLFVADGTGACDSTKTITIVPAAGHTINGQSSQVIASPYGKFVLHFDDALNLWIV
jgi:hypothetical protein